MKRPAAAFATVAVLAAATPAYAASVAVERRVCVPEQSKYGLCGPDEAHFAADPGEANRVTITRHVDPPDYQPIVTYRDGGAALHAGDGCTQLDDHSAQCTGYLLTPVVDTGDGDDVVDGTDTVATVDAGPGDDVVTGDGVLNGGPGDDQLNGGPQNDTLLGGPGRDALSGGAGNDTLQPDDGETGEQDTIDGGEGVDLVSYEKRKDDLTISLQQPLAGEDRISGIESIRGGAGSDRLTGDAGPNLLEGREGDDRLLGGDGNDVLDGGAGVDSLDAGDGADKLYAGPGIGAHDVLACGAGVDQAGQLGPQSLVTATCERVVQDQLDLMLGSLALHLPARASGPPLLVLNRLACIERPCLASVRVTGAAGRYRGRLLALRRFTLAPGAKAPRRLGVPLTALGARAVRRSQASNGRVVIALRDGHERASSTFLVALGHLALGVPALHG